MVLSLPRLLHPLSADGGDEGDAGRDLMAGEAFTAGAADGGSQGFLVGDRGDDVHDDSLAGKRVRFAPGTAIGHAGHG